MPNVITGPGTYEEACGSSAIVKEIHGDYAIGVDSDGDGACWHVGGGEHVNPGLSSFYLLPREPKAVVATSLWTNRREDGTYGPIFPSREDAEANGTGEAVELRR